MEYKEAGKILKEIIDNNTLPEDVIEKIYKDLPLVEVMRKYSEFRDIIEEVKIDLGSNVGPHKVYEYLMAPREIHKVTYEDENGNIKDLGTIEGSIEFDSNGEIPKAGDSTPNIGTISYGDKTYSTFDESIPNTDYVIGDKKENEDIWDMVDPTKYVESSQLTYGDKDDRRNKPGIEEPLYKPIFGDEDKNDFNALDELKSNDFEYGDKSVNKDNKPNKSSGAIISPLDEPKFGDDDTPPTNDNGFNGPSFGGF